MRDSPSTDEDFTTFVAARSPALYRSAWLLTTSAPAAEDLVRSALAKAYVHWRKVQGGHRGGRTRYRLDQPDRDQPCRTRPTQRDALPGDRHLSDHPEPRPG